MEYSIANEIKSQTRVVGNIYAYDFIFLVLYAIGTFFFKNLVNKHLLIPYSIFSASIAIFLTSSSGLNPLRRNYQSIIIYLQRSAALYRPIKNISRET